jgi:hypothetical protein
MSFTQEIPETLRGLEDFQPRYNLSREEAGELCSDFLREQENIPNEQFGCYIIENSGRFSNLGRFVESNVFLKTFGNTPELMEQEYGPYENASKFFVVIDQESKIPVGVMRVIENSEAGLKSLNDLKNTPLKLSEDEVLKRYDINPDKCVDVATLAILPEYRAKVRNILPSLLLYRTLYTECLDNPKFDHVVTVIDEKAEKNLNRLSFPFKPIDERYFSYLDSKKSRALFGINAEFYPSVVKRQRELEAKLATKEGGSSLDAIYAWALDNLANGTEIDGMLAFKH